MSAFFRGSHTTSSVTCGFSRSYNQAAHVPSSKVTCKSPCTPWIHCRMVLALVSMIDSITTFPSPFITAIEIVSLWTSMPIYLMFIGVLLSVEFCFTLKTYLKGAPFYNASASRNSFIDLREARLYSRLIDQNPERSL